MDESVNKEIEKEKEDSPRDEIMEAINNLKLPEPEKREEPSKISFFEKHQKPLFFLLFISSLANALLLFALFL